MVRFAQGGDLQKTRDAAASGDIGLERVHRPRFEQSSCAVESPNVLAGRHLHRSWNPSAHPSQARGIIRGGRLFEPWDVQRVARPGETQRLRRGERLVGVDEQLSLADRRLRHPRPLRIIIRVRADLDLHAATALAVRQTLQLLTELMIVIGGEAATVVDGHPIATTPKPAGKGLIPRPSLQVPKRHVHRGDGAASQTFASQIADRAPHGDGAAWDGESVKALNRLAQHAGDQMHGRRIGIGVAKTDTPARFHLTTTHVVDVQA